MADVKEFYKKYKESNERQQEEENLLRMKIIGDFVGTKKIVLDLGCYNGLQLELLRKNRNSVMGIEISDEGISECKRKNIFVVKHDITKKIPFKDKLFDVVVLGEVCEHLFNPSEVLKEIHRVLKDGGHLVLSTPNIAALTRRIKLLFGRNPNLDLWLENSSGHLRYYCYDSLKKLLIKNNFKVVGYESDFILFNIFRFKRLVKLLKGFGWTIIINAEKA